MSPNAEGRGEELRDLSQWVQLYTGAQWNFGDLTLYLTYGDHWWSYFFYRRKMSRRQLTRRRESNLKYWTRRCHMCTNMAGPGKFIESGSGCGFGSRISSESGYGSGSNPDKGFRWPKTEEKKFYRKFFYFFFWSKIAIIHHLKEWNLLIFFCVCGSFCPPGSGYGSRDPIGSGSNPDPHDWFSHFRYNSELKVPVLRFRRDIDLALKWTICSGWR